MSNKVYCEDCKYYEPHMLVSSWIWIEDRCKYPNNIKYELVEDSYIKPKHNIHIGWWETPKKRNMNNDCKDYEAKE